MRKICHTVSMAAIAVLMLLLTALIAGCSTAQPTQAPAVASSNAPDAPRLESLKLLYMVPWGEQLPVQGMTAPTNMVQADDGGIFAMDQAGRILWFEKTALDGSDAVSVLEFLDIRDRVSNRGSEEGLLGLALDPHEDGQFYVYYSAANPRRSVVSRFSYGLEGTPAEGKPADPDSELVILEVEQPYANHNGGQIAFGSDGYLYIGLGDGGSAGDPLGSGQDTSTLLGSILRIDVSDATTGQPYAIPPDNPFANGGGRPEIWAYGLRNPWRFSFDRETGELWAGDVGQNEWEEIDVIRRGGNYGWNILEGDHCYRPRDNCDREGAIPPVWEYSLDGAPCSVIGGYVYRGDAIPWLQGAYVYGDFCSGKVYGLRYQDGRVTEHKELADTGMRIMSFAEDTAGELYLLSQGEGIHRLAAGR